jgi:hypothetical protein
MHYVKIDRSRPDIEFVASKARGRVVGLANLSAQISALPPDAGRALAAINGDFYQTERTLHPGDPRGLMIVRGELISSPSPNPCFWIDTNRQPHIDIVTSQFKVTWPDGQATPIGLNEERGPGNAVLFTPTLGGSTRTRDGREFVLERHGEGPWLPLEVGRAFTGRVREVRATNDTLPAKDTMVLSVGPRLSEQVAAIKAGDVIQISTATTPDLAGVKMAIGGGPKLVHDAKPVRNAPYAVKALYERHPRSAIGFNQTHFFLVEVDGRQKELSMGMTLAELADYLVKIGCTEAMNLDGGASSQIIVGGRVMNSPSSGFERNTATGIIVLQKSAK